MTAARSRTIADTLVLGTVQFGLPYGIANASGQPDLGQVRAILDQAHEAGIRVLDTAAAYGESEAVLGACGTERWQVITKVPSFAAHDAEGLGARARESVRRSLDLLKTDRVLAVLAHDRRDMAGERGLRIAEALEPLCAEGVIGKLGASIYGPADLETLTANRIVQAPLNVLDQRMLSSGAAASLAAEGAELHVRSTFLQGLLLMDPAARPARFGRWAAELERYDQRVRDSGLSPAAFCLGFAARQSGVSRIVFGVDSAPQLAALVKAFETGQDAAIQAQDLEASDPGLIDPRMWQGDA